MSGALVTGPLLMVAQMSWYWRTILKLQIDSLLVPNMRQQLLQIGNYHFRGDLFENWILPWHLHFTHQKQMSGTTDVKLVQPSTLHLFSFEFQMKANWSNHNKEITHIFNFVHRLTSVVATWRITEKIPLKSFQQTSTTLSMFVHNTCRSVCPSSQFPVLLAELM